MFESVPEGIHIFVPYGSEDPRVPLPAAPEGVIVHRGPPLHPDDMDVVDGIPVTSVARTLIDCAQDATPEELRAMVLRAIELGLFDYGAMQASLARVEWRPSLAMVHDVLAGLGIS